MAARVLGAAVTWLALWGLWLLLAGSAAPPELAVGAAGATVVLAIALRVVAVVDVAWEPRMKWWREARRVPARVARDTALVLGTVVGRPPPGGLARRRLTPLPDDRRERARRALLTFLLSIAPNTIVIGFEDGRMLVHQLRSRRSDLDADI